MWIIALLFLFIIIIVLIRMKRNYFQDKLSMNITLEQGKTVKGAQGDVLRGLGQYVRILMAAIFA